MLTHSPYRAFPFAGPLPGRDPPAPVLRVWFLLSHGPQLKCHLPQRPSLTTHLKKVSTHHLLLSIRECF